MPEATRKFTALSGADKWLHLEALASLTYTSLALKFRPAQKLVHRHPDTHLACGQGTDDTASRVGLAVARVAGHCFWHPACLPQALAAARLLKRRDIPCSIELGVKKTPDAMEAHAWVDVSGTIIIGQNNRHEYEAIGPLANAGETLPHGLS